MINEFGKSAQHALLFIPIQKIRVSSYLGPHKHHQESLAVEKTTVNLPGFSEVTKVHHQQSPPSHWSILFETIPLEDMPPEFKECLSDHKIQTLSVGIAGAIDTPPPQHRPFLGVPLLDTISLPIHIHCTFILSDDRRSIRYDEEGNRNLESKFNKWLLTQKIPSFYLKFLSGWKSACPMKKCPWWPNRTTTDRISQVIVEAMGALFPTSNELICDTFSHSRIAPSKAHFLQQSCPSGLLLALLPEDLAIIPPRLSHLPSLQTVDSGYLTTVLQDNTSSIISMYKEGIITVDDVVNVAKFLKLSSPINSLGLPLLPLSDGTLVLLSEASTTYYCPSRIHTSPWLPFPPHHFLDPKASKEHTIYDPLKVHKLDAAAISELIKMKVPEQDTFSSSPELELWFGCLWDLLSSIPEVRIEDPLFQRLPLIPTHGPGTLTRISFQQLAESDVLFVEDDTDFPLDACVALGMRPIRARKCRTKLKEIIRSQRKGEQSTGIHWAVIKFFMNLPRNEIPNRFRRLSHNLHSEFSQWFLGQLGSSYRPLPNAEKVVIQLLPLWERVAAGSAPVRFVSAKEAVVIPAGVDPDVVRRWATGSTTYIRSGYPLPLVTEPGTVLDFYEDELAFPSIMKTMTSTYKLLLTEVLRSSRPSTLVPKLLVPNARGTMTFSNTLYLSTHATFAAAFASQNKMFLHPGLRDLEHQLRNWGLISTLTASSFRSCASAIDQDTRSDDIHTRALTVFRAYNTELPPELMRDRGSRYALQNLRFIPRSMNVIRYGSVQADPYHSLPNIVSPSEIVDPKFFGIAWTQRATCLVEPSPELRNVNSLDSIWEPTAQEVVSPTFLPSALHSSPILDQTPPYSFHEGRA